MDFNFKKIASDASAAINRAVQFTEEKFGKAEKTELDANFMNLLHRADKTEEHTKRLLSAMEGYLQPNPTVRAEELLYEKLELRKEQSRQNNLEWLGQTLTDAGAEFGPETPYGDALQKVGATEFKLGAAERELVNSAAANSLAPVKRFLEGDMRTIAKERSVLMNKRLDLDACKTRMRKAKSLESQATSKSGITVEQAEADLRVAQSEFDKQAEILKLLLEGIQTAHPPASSPFRDQASFYESNSHLKCLRDFVEAQMSFYAQAHQHMADLQRQLSGASVPRLVGGGGAGLVHNDLQAPFDARSVQQRTPLDPADMGTRTATVLFDYDAVNPQEMSVVKGDVLIVYRLPGLDPDFVMAEKGGNRGRVPISYLDIEIKANN